MSKQRLSESDFRKLPNETLQDVSSRCCGYIRNPELLRPNYVSGKCSLTGRHCEYELPKRTEDCTVVQRRFR